jgi:hypothetical protein
MSSVPEWREEGPDVVVIVPGSIGPARLFGLPFAAIGAYFLYQLAGGAAGGELTAAGWIVLPVMAAVFLAPGWIILFGHKRTRIQVSLREATEEFDFLVYTRRQRTRIPAGAHVLLRYEKIGERYPAHVHLVISARKMILLAIMPDGDAEGAIAFARKVAARLGLDVHDRRVENGEVAAGGVVVDRLGPDEAD